MDGVSIWLMESPPGWCLGFLFLFFFIFSHGVSLMNFTAESLDALIRDYAVESLVGRHTGKLYPVQLPAELSGVEASVIRLRSGQFWSYGTNNSDMLFQIPGKVMAVPHVRRLAIIFKNFGNWSSVYYKLPNYSLISPVLGFSVYDLSNNTSSSSITEIDFIATGDPVLIMFPRVTFPAEMNDSEVKCASFGKNGSVNFSQMKIPSQGLCYARSTGNFAIVVTGMSLRPPVVMEEENPTKWRKWVIVCGVGVAGLVTLGLVGIAIYKVVKSNGMKEMERQAQDLEALECVWVGRSKMPSAAMMRTQPLIETETTP